MTEQKTYKKEVEPDTSEEVKPSEGRPVIEEPEIPNVTKDKVDEKPQHRGLDIGTNMLVAAKMDSDGSAKFNMQRDAFYKIVPKSEVNKNSIRMSLDKRQCSYIIDEEDNFIVVGEDALEIAIERHDKVERPLSKGVISPQNKKSLPMLKLIIKELLGPSVPGSKVVYSVPAAPVDTNFDIIYHTEIMGSYLKKLGYDSSPINEAFAIALSELLDEGLTGIAVSCLVPGTKIYTDRGITNIEDVSIDDKVLTHRGRFRNVNKVITKEFKGLCTKLQLQGYSNNTDFYKFVDNHELYVNRDGKWQWVGCEEVMVGDIVGEPIIKKDLSKNRPSITICERVTSSNTYSKKHVSVTADVQRLIGYFLGDGSICERDSGIQFDFEASELNNIEDVSNILKKNFNKNVLITKKSENCKRIKCFSKGMASWFRKNCYDSNKIKRYPWSLDRITNSDCLNLLTGLIRSDGKIDNNSISFYNTSTSLVLLVKQLFSILGTAASINFREPREHLFYDRLISGTKQEWCVTTGKKYILNSLSDLISNMSCDNSKFCDKLFILDGFCCSRVQNIEYEEYSGIVYDLQVEEDHSFSGPFLTIHNCGAGMVNTVVIHQGDPLVEFSLTRSGDYIDNQVGQALDMSPSLVQQEKESGIDLYNPVGEISEAISVYYNTVIKYTLENIAYEMNVRKKELPIIKEEIPLVLSGGLTLAGGFVNKVQDVINDLNFPLNIGEVRRAKSPMTSVAHGCLLAAYL